MTERQRLVFVNGRLVPEREATISIFDVGRLYGATFYESIRTFRHQFFKLEEHLDRLEASLVYAGLGGLVERDEVRDAAVQVRDANLPLTDPDDDLWVCVEVTPGTGSPSPLAGAAAQSPTLIAYSSALPHEAYARYYAEGKRAVTARFRSVPPQSFEQRCKSRSRLPHFLAKLEVQALDPEASALLLDIDGSIAEGTGANVFFAAGGVLRTPATRNILDGISRQTVIELAARLGIETQQRDLTLYDAYTAEEAFWTSTSYCLLPISAIDGRRVGRSYPGPMALRLLVAWSEMVGVDIIAQAQRFAARRANDRDPESFHERSAAD
jgi:branched-chain amino acid aminotransferase